MSTSKGKEPKGGSGDKNNKSKDVTIAKAVGAVIVTGIAWSLYKSFSFRKNENETIGESYSSSSDDEYSADRLGIAFKHKSDVQEGKKELYSASQLSCSEGNKRSGKTLAKFKSGLYYEINDGDTLYGISGKYGISVDALKAANGFFGDNIYAGDNRVIPM